MSDDAIERVNYPTLTDAGRRLLQHLREHPSAPSYRNQSGNRLFAADLEGLREFERETLAASVGWPAAQLPDWVPAFVQDVYADVPWYRALGPPPRRFADVPTIARGDLAADIARFVPDSLPLERLINFRTTGTTGQPLLIASHPVVAARYLAFHKRALRRFGIELAHGRGQVGVVLIGYQRECFTYVSVTPLMDESGLAKINLHPGDWRNLDDRARYLDAMAPEVIAGDPISFAELLELPLATRPKALVCVSMALSEGLRGMLEARFGCPVLDVYSLNEVGPVGVHDPAAGGHVLLQPRLYVEVLDANGNALAPGQRGEIAVTGGFNFCLPLLRYRTGDFGALAHGADAPVIVGLSGRQPIRFRSRAGHWLNNIDVSHALRGFPFSRYSVHQRSDGSIVLRLPPAARAHAGAAIVALKALLDDPPVEVDLLAGDDKCIQYTSDLAGATE